MAESENVPQFNPPKTIVREYAEMILVTGVQVLFLMTFIFQAMNVPTGSMQNTINIGDQFFVNKFVYGKPESLLSKILPQREIKRGDVVVFKLPSKPSVNYIKRCIGLPGDEILVKGTSVFINGQEIPEQKVSIDIDRMHDPDGKIAAQPVKSEEPAPAGATYKTYYDINEPEHFSHAMRFAVDRPLKIPADSYFMMGDSRDNSEDSRFWGIVPRTHIVGRPLYVYWSFNTQDPSNASSADAVKFSRFGTAIK